ncbi:MAG TPA: polysaccharide biosynthesis protein, partial [Acidimicrobiia bacterium]|nr:polysaccharide biosynthesis protein [Acidimicrobiia bacterium]
MGNGIFGADNLGGVMGITTHDRKWRLRLMQGAAHLRADLSFAVIDSFLIVLAYTAAMALRFVESSAGIPQRWLHGFLTMLPVILAIHLVCNIVFGAYGHVWEHASVAEALRMVGATLTAGGIIIGIVLVGRELVEQWGLVPVGVVAMGSMLTVAGMGAVRFRSRMFSFKRSGGAPAPQNTLVVGTGRMAADVARHLSPAGSTQVAGFVSIDGHQKRLLAGRPVLGTLEEIDHLVRVNDIDQIVVAGTHSDETMRELVDRCLHVDVRLRIVPDIVTALNGNGTSRDIRDLELRDLLPRPQVATDLAGAAEILADRRVLVTGAGGSIGSVIVRQALGFGAAQVVALDHDETHLFDSGISWSPHEDRVVFQLCDIRDREALERIFVTHRPEVVFHAAAHKHVPMLELSADEAVKTNVLGTQHLLEAARFVGSERFILISTDKAVRPTSVMGASKRVAEMLVQAEAIRTPACRFSSVRFGNVLGSRGSVVPTFLRQIQRGGPVTVTDPEMVRYFMTVDEAVELVLQAAALTENGETFVLDMGEPIKIIDLAHRLIRLAGLVPGRH